MKRIRQKYDHNNLQNPTVKQLQVVKTNSLRCTKKRETLNSTGIVQVFQGEIGGMTKTT